MKMVTVTSDEWNFTSDTCDECRTHWSYLPYSFRWILDVWSIKCSVLWPSWHLDFKGIAHFLENLLVLIFVNLRKIQHNFKIKYFHFYTFLKAFKDRLEWPFISTGTKLLYALSHVKIISTALAEVKAKLTILFYQNVTIFEFSIQQEKVLSLWYSLLLKYTLLRLGVYCLKKYSFFH